MYLNKHTLIYCLSQCLCGNPLSFLCMCLFIFTLLLMNKFVIKKPCHFYFNSSLIPTEDISSGSTVNGSKNEYIVEWE